MKDWKSILELWRSEESAALGVTTLAFGRYSQQWGLERARKDPYVLRTSEWLDEVRAQLNLLPGQIAEDVTEPELRWHWARELYWGYGCPEAEIAKDLLRCSIAQIPDLVGPSPDSLRCAQCHSEFSPLSQEDWRSAFSDGFQMRGKENWGPVCRPCASRG